MGFNEMHAEAVAGVVDRVINRYKRDPTCMLQILREVQESCDWIPPEAIDRMQAMLGVPRTKIEGVAGFYSFIYTEPRGKYRVLFSDNITDRMQGNRAMMERLCNNLWVERGKVSEDGLVSVGKTACTGLCDQGPALLINHHQVITRLDAGRVDALAALMLSEVPVDHWPTDWFHVDNTMHRADALLTGLPADAPALSAVIARVP